MCKYTIYSYECGDPAEDHVDTRDCAEFRRTGVHCDRDNPANRDRVKVRAKTRNGLCTRCLRKGQEKEEIAAMEREFERAKEESRLEARKREEEMQRAEQKAREESLAEFEKKKAALAAETAEVERLTKEKYDQERRQQEQKHLDFMLRKSAEEAELKRQRDEQEELQKALIESLSFGDYPIEYQDEVITTGKKDIGGGRTAEWQWTKTDKTTITKSDRASVPPPPPLPPVQKAAPVPAPAAIPSPPPLPPTPKSPVVQRPALPSKQEPEQRSWHMPAVGEQKYGHLMIGGRSQPIHPSQEIPSSPKTLSTPSGPAPEGRLQGVIAPTIPILRQQQGQVPTTDARATLRRFSGPRSPKSPSSEPQVDPQLQKLLDKRRKWEEEEEEKSSTISITPSQSAPNIGTRTNSSLGGATPGARSASDVTEEVRGNDVEDAITLQARRLERFDFDAKRKAGWKADSQD